MTEEHRDALGYDSTRVGRKLSEVAELGDEEFVICRRLAHFGQEVMSDIDGRYTGHSSGRVV